MKLRRALPSAPRIPVMPLANLALLVWMCVMVASMYSASRGPGLRFAAADRDDGPNAGAAVRLEVSSEQEARVDGTLVPFGDLADEVAARLKGRPDPSVILIVSPEASYEALVAAYAAIAGLPGPPRIAVPALAREPRG